MKKLQKTGFLLLVLALVLTVSASFAAELNGGEVGGFTQPDTPNVKPSRIPRT